MVDGKYNWDGTKLRIAHAECYLNTLQALQLGYDVVVANTFIRVKDMTRYLKINLPRLNISIIEMKSSYYNIHNVPQEAIERMQSRWQELPNITSWPELPNINIIRIY